MGAAGGNAGRPVGPCRWARWAVWVEKAVYFAEACPAMPAVAGDAVGFQSPRT